MTYYELVDLFESQMNEIAKDEELQKKFLEYCYEVIRSEEYKRDLRNGKIPMLNMTEAILMFCD